MCLSNNCCNVINFFILKTYVEHKPTMNVCLVSTNFSFDSTTKCTSAHEFCLFARSSSPSPRPLRCVMRCSTISHDCVSARLWTFSVIFQHIHHFNMPTHLQRSVLRSIARHLIFNWLLGFCFGVNYFYCTSRKISSCPPHCHPKATFTRPIVILRAATCQLWILKWLPAHLDWDTWMHCWLLPPSLCLSLPLCVSVSLSGTHTHTVKVFTPATRQKLFKECHSEKEFNGIQRISETLKQSIGLTHGQACRIENVGVVRKCAWGTSQRSRNFPMALSFFQARDPDHSIARTWCLFVVVYCIVHTFCWSGGSEGTSANFEMKKASTIHLVSLSDTGLPQPPCIPTNVVDGQRKPANFADDQKVMKYSAFWSRISCFCFVCLCNRRVCFPPSQLCSACSSNVSGRLVKFEETVQKSLILFRQPKRKATASCLHTIGYYLMCFEFLNNNNQNKDITFSLAVAVVLKVFDFIKGWLQLG